MQIIVLAGGFSSEKQISELTGKSVVASINSLQGYDARLVNPADFGKLDFVKFLQAQKTGGQNPKLIFNGLHGGFGEDGTLASICDWLEIPYTHSGSLASSMAMDKVFAKEIYQNIGLKVAKSIAFKITDACSTSLQEYVLQLLDDGKITLPFVLKPRAEGSSLLLFIIKSMGDVAQLGAIKTQDYYGKEFMAEEFITGREFSVAILEENGRPQALGAVEISPRNGVYDYDAKYTTGGAEITIPPKLPEQDLTTLENLGLQAHIGLKCQALSRSDFILNEQDNQFYILETNTHPGLTELSHFPKIAKSRGITYNELIEKIIHEATRQ